MSIGVLLPANGNAASGSSTLTVRSVTAADIGTWDPSSGHSPTTRWFVIAGDKAGNGSWSMQTSYGGQHESGVLITAPGSADRIALATLAPNGTTAASVTGIDEMPGAASSDWLPVFGDLDCNGSSAGGIVRTSSLNYFGGTNPVTVDRNVYADGSTGSGSGTPVFVAGHDYPYNTVAAHCPVLRDYGVSALPTTTALLQSLTLGTSGTDQRDWFRPAAPGTAAPVRLGGRDRIDTALAAAGALEQQVEWQLHRKFDHVVLARYDTFADSLPGTVLARRYSAPLLLTPTTVLDSRVARFLATSVQPGATVFVLGQTDALSSRVADAVTALGLHVQRVGGNDRFATAGLIADLLQPNVDDEGGPGPVTVADGLNFPDALVAADLNEPIVYSARGAIPSATAQRMAIAPYLFVVGGPAASAVQSSSYRSKVTSSFVGTDRYDTSAKVLASMPLGLNEDFYQAPTVISPDLLMTVAVATGQNFPDALAGAAGAEVALTMPGTLPASVASVLAREAPAIGTVQVMGTADVVSDAVATQVQHTLIGHDVTTWPSGD